MAKPSRFEHGKWSNIRGRNEKEIVKSILHLRDGAQGQN
jgi:hypothetical protein